jgi:transglutaminase-like putative cysteine protease
VYFPAGGLLVDRYGSIRSPILLDKGLVYSVVSDVPVTEPRILRWAQPPEPAVIDPTYLQLPQDLPSRVGALARRITADADTQYDRVAAVQSWIRSNTRYDLDVPRDPVGVDAVDHFLFVTRTGFCEQIAGLGVARDRFDFPYMRAGRRAPDRAPVLIEALALGAT